MQIFHTIEEWIAFRKQLPKECSLGFAPTMGNLHPGHASLFIKSKAENHYTVSSLFVNPTQFNQEEDFIHYPRTLDADIKLMSESGVDFCILPTQAEIYPDGYTYQVQENSLCKMMEGLHRPGHFDGVLTVVMKLLQITQAQRAYFGEKDYQQYLLIKGMAKAFFMDVDIIPCPTIRETSGLAYSSRNNRLSLEEKKRAEEFAKIFHQNKACALIAEELNAKNIKVEYIESVQNRKFAAVLIGGIRLIDNYAIELE